MNAAALIISIATISTLGLSLVVLVVARVVWRNRYHAGQRIIGYVEAAVRLEAPLPEMIEAAATTEPYRVGIRLNSLAGSLRSGASIRDALIISAPQVPMRIRELIGAAERTGRLAPVMRQIISREQQLQERTLRPMDWLYPVIIVSSLVAIAFAMMIFVLPKFQEIYLDFNLGLPWISQKLFSSQFIMIMVMSMGVIAAIVLCFAGIAILTLCDGMYGQAASLDMLREKVTNTACRIPFIGRAINDTHLADVCGIVGSALHAGLPMDSALMETQSLRINAGLRRKVIRWADGIRSGMAVDHAARAARMPTLVVGMFATGQAAGDPAQTFEFLYRHYSHRFSRALELARGAIIPVSIITLGGVVGFWVMALMMPLFDIIENMLIM